jgi:regulator of sirC expression with transglutaminase-like and TPR domain
MLIDFRIKDEFLDLARARDDDIDLAKAALVIAKSEYPELRVDDYLGRLVRMSETLDERLERAAPLSRTIAAMNRYLFDELGFAGNVDDYFDPRNSFLNEVLERRLGIPISLSIIYMDIARRLGLPMMGVSFPGHFLVKLTVSGGDGVLDPFAGGVSLTVQDLRLRLRTIAPDNHEPDLQTYLRPVSNRDILVRMLRNLKGIYYEAGLYDKALRTAEHLLVLAPSDPHEIRDRGYIYERLQCPRAASADFERYLSLAPDANDADHVRELFIESQSRSTSLH